MSNPSLPVRFLKWAALLLLLAALTGSACAFFLWSLDEVTRIRSERPWLLYLLPIAGVLLATLYARFGNGAERGNTLILEQIQEHKDPGVPRRMSLLVLFGTLLTHLFGGSAGREGTAVQMGGSFAAAIQKALALDATDTSMLLRCGMAAGFGAVFGTPLAGAVFALEVTPKERFAMRALLPCLCASFLGHAACMLWGAHHTHYPLVLQGETGLVLLLKVALAAVAFGLAARVFVKLGHVLQVQFKSRIAHPGLRAAVGGSLVIALTFVLGTTDYLGLGVSSPDPHAVTILSSFNAGGAHALSWLWKLVLTCVTLSCGFKGGEVTPLFFIGAALGNSLAVLLGAPVELFAALGFVAVFGSAAKTPLACTVLALELFGAGHPLLFGFGCVLAWMVSGEDGIYNAT